MEEKLRWFFAFAHSDDELGVIATMSRVVSSGHEVNCVWTTDGALRGDSNKRKIESIQVMNKIGVPEKNLTFMGFNDGNSHQNLCEVTEQMIKLMDQVRPHKIIVNGFECGHQDHDTVNFAVQQARKQIVPASEAFEFPLYHTYAHKVPTIGKFALNTPKPQLFRLTREEYSNKHKISRLYPSQKLFFYLCLWELRCRLLGYTANLARIETFRTMPDWNYTVPPTPSQMKNRVIKTQIFQDFKAQVRKYQDSQKSMDEPALITVNL